MIKMYTFPSRRPDISLKEFRSHWRGIHVEYANRIERIRHYRQSHRISSLDSGLAAPPCDGCAEVWFDDLESALGMGTDPDYTEYAQRDEPTFVDMDALTFGFTNEEILSEPPLSSPRAPSLKLLQLVRRAPDLEADEFHRRWACEGEQELGGELGAVGHVISRVLQTDDGVHAPAPFDGIRELVWPDLQTFDAVRRDRVDAWGRLVDDRIVDAGSSSGFMCEELHYW